RVAAPAEAALWLPVLQRGTREQVLAGLQDSVEAFRKAGGTDDAWLDQLYVNVLGRGRTAGERFFLDALQGGATREPVAAAILASPEYHRARVSGYYGGFLRRTGSDAELDRWVGRLQGGVSDEQVVAAIVASPEYVGRAGDTPDAWQEQLLADLFHTDAA